MTALAVAACTPTTTSTVTRGDHGNFEISTPSGCGVERWAVKTGTDAAASQVNLSDVHDTTVAALNALPVPTGFSQDAPRLPGAEFTVWRVSATLVEFKMEADSDYHLVLRDDAGNTMIAEIPKPSCVHGVSPFLAGITNARQQFDAKYPSAGNGVFQTAGVPVTVTGVGFFDTLHGQTGAAKNGFEEHPVDDVTFGTPSPAPSTPSPTSTP
jgi:hypothetical protein